MNEQSLVCPFLLIRGLDIDMPQMDGWDFLNEFNNLPVTYLMEKTSVFILSSSNHYNDKAKAEKLPFSKPLTKEIVETICSFKIVQKG